MNIDDIKALPLPAVITQKSYASILSESRAALLAKDPTLEEALNNPAEPITLQLEVFAYREYIIRQEFNDRAAGLFAAFATNTDLDHIGVTYYKTARLALDAGNPSATPPIAPTYESDDAYLSRFLLSPYQHSTAGARKSYEFHALSADGTAKDVSVESAVAGTVDITVLSTEGDGTAAQALLDNVTSALNDESIRPLSDTVAVQAATIINYTINATLTLYGGFDASTVLAASQASIDAWTASQHRIGREITEAGIHKALKVEGVHDIVLNDTANGTDITTNLPITSAQAGYCLGSTLINGGIV